MTSAITYALLSLCFAGLNDVIFKHYSAKDRSRGMVIFGIGVVVLSVLFLHEELSPMKTMGIGTGIVAVLLLLYRPERIPEGKLQSLFIWLVILASLLRAIYGVISKAGLNQGADVNTMLLIAAGCWIVGGALYARLREGRFRLTRKKAIYSLISGLLVYLIVNFLIAAVKLGEASVVIPIANLSFVAALLISVKLGMEHLSLRKLTAIGFAISSVWLLSLT